MTVSQISRSLTRMDIKKDLIEVRLYFALLRTNTGTTMRCRAKFSSSSISWFLSICKNWVEAELLFSQSYWFMSILLTCSSWLWLWVSFSKMLSSITFIAASISWNKIFVFAFFWGANFSRAPIKDATTCWGSELQKKICSFTSFEELDTDIGTYFPIQVFVFVSLKVSSWTQIDSTSIFFKVLKRFCWLVCLLQKKSNLSKRVSRIWYDLLAVTFFYCSLHLVICRSKLGALLKKVSQLGQRKDWKTALNFLP